MRLSRTWKGLIKPAVLEIHLTPAIPGAVTRRDTLRMGFMPRRLPHCLLVEDSDYDQRRIAHLLARGTQVELDIATTLAQARLALSRKQFDLLLLNNLLADGLGVDFAAEIRRTPQIPFVPIIMISDFTSPFMYDKAMAAKVSIVVDKDKFQPRHVHDALQFARVMATTRR